MKKEIYDRAEIEVISFTMTNVLLINSPETDDDDELPFVPKQQ